LRGVIRSYQVAVGDQITRFEGFVAADIAAGRPSLPPENLPYWTNSDWQMKQR
jgi:hypothetical protein